MILSGGFSANRRGASRRAFDPLGGGVAVLETPSPFSWSSHLMVSQESFTPLYGFRLTLSGRF